MTVNYVATLDGRELARLPSLQAAVAALEDAHGIPPASACTAQVDYPVPDVPVRWLVYASQAHLELDADRAPASFFGEVTVDAG